MIPLREFAQRRARTPGSSQLVQTQLLGPVGAARRHADGLEGMTGLFRRRSGCSYDEDVPTTDGDTRPTRPRPARAVPRRSRGCLPRVLLWTLGATIACVLGLGVLMVGMAAGAEFGSPADLTFVEDVASAYGIDSVFWPTATVPSPAPVAILREVMASGRTTSTAFQPGSHYTETPPATPTPTASATATPTETGSQTETPTGSVSPSVTASPSRTSTVTRTMSPYRTWTPSRTPSRTSTRTPTPTPTWTGTPGPPSPTATATWTPGPPTDTPGPGTVYPTETPSNTPSNTPVPPTDTAVPPTATSEACNLSGNSGFENTMLGLINAERQNQGLRAYAMQSQLQAAARVHSADMACNSFISHTGSDGSGVRDRVARQGYSWSWIGENIMSTSNTSSAPQVAFDWWMNSAPHRANLMSPNYTEIGIGYRYNPDTRRGYFTAVFARP